MAEEASVILSAVNNVSGPTAEATASLAKYQAAIDSMASLTGRSVGAAAQATAGINNVSAAAAASVVPHGAAHKALNLVSGSLVGIAGGSAAASAAIRVMDSVMFAMVTTGGAVSIGFVAIVAAAAAVGYAFKTSAENAKKQKDEMDSLTDNTIKYVSQLDYMDRVQKSVAGVGLAKSGERITELKNQIENLTESMRKNAEQAILMSTPMTINVGEMEGTRTIPGRDVSSQNKEQIRMAGELRVLQVELEKTERAQDSLARKVVVFSGNLEYSSLAVDRLSEEYHQTDAILKAIGTEGPEEILKIADAADAVGISFDAMQSHMTAAKNKSAEDMKSLTDIVVSSSVIMAQAIGVASLSGQNAFVGMANAMIDAMTQIAIQVITKFVVMTQAAILFDSAAKGGLPGFLIGLASIGVVAAVGAAMKSAVSSSAHIKVPASTQPGIGGMNNGSPSSGAGGTTISSAQSQITNNMVVNMPVQALDLAAVSDIQLKNLANRVGRVLAEASGQGQFSLVGA